MREIREVWSHFADAAKEARSDPKNEFATVQMARDGGKRFRMLTRDPNKDSYISATILAGELWEPFVREPLIQAIKGQSLPVFIDVGANLGYFTHTALAMGARVISFEPMYLYVYILYIRTYIHIHIHTLFYINITHTHTHTH